MTSDRKRAAVSVSAGVVWDDFVAQMVGAGYVGLECMSGIPGLVGATMSRRPPRRRHVSIAPIGHESPAPTGSNHMRREPLKLLLLPLIPALGFGIVGVAQRIAVPGSTTATPVAITPTVAPVVIAPAVAPPKPPPPCIECTAVF